MDIEYSTLGTAVRRRLLFKEGACYSLDVEDTCECEPTRPPPTIAMRRGDRLDEMAAGRILSSDESCPENRHLASEAGFKEIRM